MDEQQELGGVGLDFVRAAFGVLTEEHVLPTPRYHRHLAAGRDYFGPDLMDLTEFKTLEARINEKYPNRFKDPLTRKNAQFANTFIFSFPEAAIARCALSGDFDAGSASVNESIAELLTVLDASSQEIVCVRSVTHLTTASGNEVQIGDIRIIPGPPGYSGPADYIRRVVPGAPTAWNRELPRRFDPPHALLVTREAVADPGDFYGASRMLSGRLERFLLIVRLLTSGPVQTVFEISGASTLTSPMRPYLREFGKTTTVMGRTLVRLGAQRGHAERQRG